ncbi:hypothetical protein PHYBOEH_006054 [Phytophthora boehmeriae]|uniref:Uncharacterized protein n=1 Tax=Phytophthora boehmeriae TaxID=109152 RepID=A0A8T1WM04_9STRA|nr:hypothetical protein PHYBOEH_006054 [Phytophthora boehmeriae]
MMSPEAFRRTHKRHVTDVIRVSLDQKGVIGFIDVHDGMTLLEARSQIWENVEDAPAEFQFVLDDGVPVSARQEGTQKIVYFYPMVHIRELRRDAPPPIPSPKRTSTSSAVNITTNLTSSPNSSEKVCVSTASGEEFHVWVSEDYTFQQLRRDSARYWNIPAAEVALADGEGCLWPEQAKILSLMSLEDLHNKRIILEYKGGTLVAKGLSSVSLKDAISASSAGGTKRPGTRRSFSASALALSLPQPMRLARTTPYSTPPFSLQRAHPATDQVFPVDTAADTVPTSDAAPSTNPVEELWRIFTFYCVNGDSMELECLKAHQFNKLLRDSRVFGSHLTPAMVDIIYTSETKGKLQASGKMNYDEFLNALVKVARAANTKRNRANNSNKLLSDNDEEDMLFQQLVVEHILPLASRWPTNTWQEYTQRLRRPEIVSFMSKFLEPLLDIFTFYANSSISNASGVKEFYMSYADYQKFVNDFCFANLQVSSIESAHVFLAACSSPPFHGALFEANEPGRSDCSNTITQGTTKPSGSRGSGNGGSAWVASIQRILENAEGVVAYTFPQNQVGRVCMGVSAFLDALGRTGLTAFLKTHNRKTIHCVKGIFHHLSRGLTRSRMLTILKNHGSTSMHAAKFYSGSVLFSNKFLDMWRYEGSPDYISGDDLPGYAGSPDAKLSSPRGSESYTGIETIVSSMNAAYASCSSRRDFSAPFSSSALFNDKNVPAGSGRGREALDRLVRNAFLRNAIVANDMNTRVGLDQRRASMVGSTGTSLRTTIETSANENAPLSVLEEECGDKAAANYSGNTLTTGGLLEKLGSKQNGIPAFDIPAIDTREATLPSDGRAASPPRNPNVQQRASVSPPSSPSKQQAYRQHDEKVFFESILLKGGVFKKYGQWGNPHRRFVWCSKDFDAICWRPLNKKSSLTKDGIPTASMISVLPGNSTRTRYAFMKHLSDGTFIGCSGS